MDLLTDIRYALLPEAIITLLIIICTILTFILPGKKQSAIYYISSIGAVVALILFSFIPFFDETKALWGSFTSNTFTIVFRVLILIGSLITLQLSKKYISGFGNSIGEFYVLILIATLGAMLLAGSNDLIMIFIAMETLSISSFALCGYTKLDKLSNEAALKYLVIGAASTAILLYGFSFIYGITGQTNLADISNYLITYGTNIVLIISFLLILGGFGYKLAAVPFHTWAPDVYQGSPIPVAAFLSVVSKIAGFAIIIRVLTLFINNIPIWSLSIAVIAILTMTLGNLTAINQTNIRRLMAYSSIAQAGYILIGLAIATYTGISSMIFYLIVYLFTNFGTWAAIEMHINHTGKDSIEAFNGLASKQPILAFGLTICLLSLAGIPFTAGFFGKFYLFQAVVFAGSQYLWLLIIALLNTVVAVYYYLKIVKSMFLRSYVAQEAVITPSKSLNAVLGFTVIAVILLGFIASPLISLSELSASKIELHSSIETPLR
jgi:NAD(P)H-quinone oxidoreductase subunit 2